MEQLIRMELPCVKDVMLVGELKEHLAALLTLQTGVDEVTNQSNGVLTEEAQRWFKNMRLDSFLFIGFIDTFFFFFPSFSLTFKKLPSHGMT